MLRSSTCLIPSRLPPFVRNWRFPSGRVPCPSSDGVRKSSDAYSPASGVAAVSSQAPGEQGIFPQDRRKGVYGNSRPLHQSKAQGESRHPCSNQLIECELQNASFQSGLARRDYRFSERKSGLHRTNRPSVPPAMTKIVPACALARFPSTGGSQ